MANKSRQRPVIERAFPLIDIDIERGGDGRTVTAYAATFGDPYEVRDQFGHYFETINRAAFNRTLGRGLAGIQVLFNHGRTIDGTPSERFSMPLGKPIDVRPDSRGLLTVTRYSKTPLADEALELIRDGAVSAQSFRGPIVATARPVRHESGLMLVERTELGLREYGPAPFPANIGAAMVAVRSSALLAVDPEDLTAEEKLELIALLGGNETEPPAPGGVPAAPAGGTEGDPQAPPAAPEVAPAPGPSTETLALEVEQARRRLGLTSTKEN